MGQLSSWYFERLFHWGNSPNTKLAFIIENLLFEYTILGIPHTFRQRSSELIVFSMINGEILVKGFWLDVRTINRDQFSTSNSSSNLLFEYTILGIPHTFRQRSSEFKYRPCWHSVVGGDKDGELLYMAPSVKGLDVTSRLIESGPFDLPSRWSKGQRGVFQPPGSRPPQLSPWIPKGSCRGSRTKSREGIVNEGSG
jgi:hypothetical protein